MMRDLSLEPPVSTTMLYLPLINDIVPPAFISPKKLIGISWPFHDQAGQVCREYMELQWS